jgi:hypothetical protein
MRSLLFRDVTQRRLVVKLPMFWDNLPIPSSRVKQSRPLKVEPISYPETSVTTNLRCITSQKSEDLRLAPLFLHLSYVAPILTVPGTATCPPSSWHECGPLFERKSARDLNLSKTGILHSNSSRCTCIMCVLRSDIICK